jgi:hypothetical protein
MIRHRPCVDAVSLKTLNEKLKHGKTHAKKRVQYDVETSSFDQEETPPDLCNHKVKRPQSSGTQM